MADNTLTIPFQEALTSGNKEFKEYLPLLSDNLYIIASLLTRRQLEEVKAYNRDKKYYEADEKEQKEVLEQLKLINDPKSAKKKDDSFWKQYKKLVGKDFDKFLPLISDNIRLTKGYLSESQKGRLKDYEARKKTLEQQSAMRKLLEEANEMKLSTNLMSKVQGGDQMSVGTERLEIRSSRFEAKDFDKYIPTFAKNMNIVAGVLTEDQKLKIKYYQQQEESAQNQKEIAKVLKEANKPKYLKIKEKLTEKYNNFILKHKWFEKSMDSFKNIARTGGHWLWELIKGFLVLTLFDRNGTILKLFGKVLMEVGQKIWQIAKQIVPPVLKWIWDGIVKVVPVFFKWLGEEIANVWNDLLKLLGSGIEKLVRAIIPEPMQKLLGLDLQSEIKRTKEEIKRLEELRKNDKRQQEIRKPLTKQFTEKELQEGINSLRQNFAGKNIDQKQLSSSLEEAITNGMNNMKQKEVNVNVQTGSTNKSFTPLSRTHELEN